MVNLEQKTLALFFTCGISLKTWEKVGNLEREIKPYRELAKHFKEIYFFTYGDKQDFEFKEILPDNIKIFPKKYRMPSVLYSLLLPLIYRKQLKKTALLKTNQMSGSMSAVIAKWLFNKKLIVRCGYEWLNVLEKEKKAPWKRLIAQALERLAYNSADKIIFTSQKDQAFAQNKFKIPSEKIEIIPNYIDTDLFKPSLLSVSDTDNTNKQGVVFVGRLSREKNLLNLIKAMAGMGEKLTLIGKGHLEKELKQLVQEKGILTKFKGRVPNEKLPQELNKAKVFVLPSLYEGCPKALLEAMSCGLLCIGADVEGIKEIIQHKENGYLCGTDADSIKKAISEVLGNTSLHQQMAHNARQTILEKFRLEEILKKEIAFYEAL